MSAHHFQFSRNFASGRRLCGECRRNYDDGDHIEITTLKPYTHYVCPTGRGLGHSSRWTGAYRPDGRSLRDHLCSCGAELVEEDREQWQLSWEMQIPFSHDGWTPHSVVRSRHAAQQQHDGMLQLIDQGEPIRNVVLEQLAPVGARCPVTASTPQPDDRHHYESHTWDDESCTVCGVTWTDCDDVCPSTPRGKVADVPVTNSANVRLRTELPWIGYDHRCQHRAAAADRKLMADEFYALFKAEAETGRAMRSAVLDIHKPVPTWTDSTYDEHGVQVEQNALYDGAGALIAAPDYHIHCAVCPVDTPWPCPTARAMGVTE